MRAEDRKVLLDVGAWAGNVSTSVLIIFINKILMSGKGYNFQYATTLCALHYLTCSVGTYTLQKLGKIRPNSMPLKDLALFTVTADLSIVTLNLSLLLNPVAFYQIAKLCIIPCSCFVEAFWLGRQYTRAVIFSVLIVLIGVSIVTVTDVKSDSNMLGLVVAGLSVVSSTMQQIFCRTMQQKHSLASHELLANTAPFQGWTLLAIGPMLDAFITGSWVSHYEWNVPAIVMLTFSCFMAVGVNVSQFACLGRFPAVSFQVLGHTKTILVLLGGWAFLGDSISAKQLVGIIIAILGMVLYGIATSRPQPPKSKMLTSKSSAMMSDDVLPPLAQPRATLSPPDASVKVSMQGVYRSQGSPEIRKLSDRGDASNV